MLEAFVWLILRADAVELREGLMTCSDEYPPARIATTFKLYLINALGYGNGRPATF